MGSAARLAGYGEAGSQWRGRTPIGRTVPAGAVKYALHDSTGSLGPVPNLLWLGLTAGCLLAQGQLAILAMGMGRPGRTTATYLEAIASALALSLARPSANVLAATNAPVFLLLLVKQGDGGLVWGWEATNW